MTDVLAEYLEISRATAREFDIQPGWMVAVLKEAGHIPQDAIWVSLVCGPDSVNVYWRSADDDEWTHA